ncbi:hypothetical protein VTN77DRAFT_4329 [Rasamsonia byssochlamydoides]|uniref:uncharacterized protein n=1 Tax=Rasamsonia byssochlamydoides TaxID=89139 RepID=UPI003744081B
MALQAVHLENGIWTTRHVGISELLERNRERRNDLPPKVDASKPKVGLLTQTVIPSPTIQLILPARLRSKRQNDVVFVGERSIQLREIVMGTYLEDVTIKSDFDANIVAAKAIRAYPELPWDVQMKLGAHSGSPDHSSEAEDSLPSQLLVLTLDSKELVFLYYRTEASPKDGHFVHFRRPLPSDVSILERFGRHLAVDPRSRAIAVAAPADFFGIFAMKSPQELQSQMAEGKLSPIAEERFFRVDGDILFMDFLFPEADDGDRIILLLLVAKDQHTLAVCYDWDSSESLRQARPRVTTRKLPAEYRLPNIVVPLTKATSFMLITSSSMVVYRNVLDARIKGPSSRYPIQYPERGSGLSPLWTRWARPYRNWVYNQQHDDIYLCREDGWLFYLEIGSKGEIEHQSHLGQLGCDVDAAFDVIDFDFEGGDLLLAAGNMGDGGLFIQRAREHPKCVQKFLNWSPVLDAVVVPLPSQNGSRTANTSGDRLYVCSASTTGRGAVVELRYGIEARIGLVIPLEDLSSSRYIWTMPDYVGGGTYLLISDPVSSTLLYLPRDTGEEIYAMDDSDSALDFSSQTLAAGYTTTGIVVQVTDSSIHLSAPREPDLKFVFNYETGETVVAAAVHRKHGLVVTATRSLQAMRVHVGRISSANGSLQIEAVGQPVETSHEPVSVLVEDIESDVYVFIGTSDGHLLSYRVEQEGIPQLGDHAIDLSGDDVSRAIESIARVIVVKDNGQQSSTLFCGLRSGVLVPFSIKTGHGAAIDLTQGTPRRLGQTVVRLSTNATSQDFALVTCGNGFWHLSHINNSDPLDYVLQQIWITDQNNPSYVQRSVDVFTLIDAQPNPGPDSLAGSLVCICDGQLLICTLDRLPRTVPRRIELPGSANRVTYSRHLRSLVVAYTTVEMDNHADAEPIKRYLRPHIEFIDLDNSHSEVGSSQTAAATKHVSRPWRPCGAAGERITCILDWTPKRDGVEYHFIVIGTARRNQEDNGRVIFLQTQRSAANPEQIECSVKHIHRFEGPVRAIAPYGEFTLMVATGYDVVPLEPKFSERRWARAARFRLTSPAVAITVRQSYLYVSTARESLVVLQVVNDKLELYAHDGVKREGLSHYYIGGDAKLVLATSRGGTVSALSEIGVTESDKTISPAVAEAHLPLSVIRLSPCSAPSPLPSSTVVYGTTMDGTVYRIMTLAEKEWRLLRFIQNLCSKDATLSPFLAVRKKRWTWADIEPTPNKPSHMHVNGDILARLLQRGSDHLRHMLTSDTRPPPSDAAILPPKSYMELFLELSSDLLGETSDPVSQVMDWLGKLLQFGF